MPYTLVTWTNGDIITEQKLDDMRANEDYLREEAAGARVVFAAAYPLERSIVAGAPGVPTMGFKIGALSLTSGGGGGGTFADITGTRNWNISSLAKDQIHFLTIHAANTFGTEFARVAIYVHPDMNYLNVWAQTRLAGGDGSGYYVKSIVVIATRVDKGFS